MNGAASAPSGTIGSAGEAAIRPDPPGSTIDTPFLVKAGVKVEAIRLLAALPLDEKQPVSSVVAQGAA